MSKLHRFYTGSHVELKHDFWLQDLRLIHQWKKVLRFQPDQELVLFDGVSHDRLYRLIELTDKAAHLEMITQLDRKVPGKDVYLFWSILKKDKNDWVLQKATELGVRHFVPLIADRSEKTGFNADRAQKIIIEASEQCGRSDIPMLREPMHVATALDDFADQVELYVCDQNGSDADIEHAKSLGVLIGPEGGWSDLEKQLFIDKKVRLLNIHDFTLRAETAAVASITKLLQ